MLNTSSSIVPQDSTSSGPTSLAEVLFERPGYVARVIPSAGSEIHCNFCARTAFQVIGNTITVTQRHGNAWHRTVVDIADLGLKRVE